MPSKRYSSVAISLHWLIAILLVGLVVLAKVMNSFEDNDPFRFELIQWHKSFGIMVLLLVVCRLLWRLTHRPPRLPSGLSKLERFGASGAHLVLYLLMFAIPLSGWIMVSASPLNLKTELFGLIPWPHLPAVSELPDKAAIAEQFVEYHHLLAQGLMIVVVLHVAAALRHQFFLKDNVMSRMLLSAEHGRDNRQGIVVGLLLAFAGSLFLVNQIQVNAGSKVVANAAGTVNRADSSGDIPAGTPVVVSSVDFIALQLGEEINGVFERHEIFLVLNEDAGSSSLKASVETASINTGDSQIDGTVVTDEWFASSEFPVATFVSDKVEKQIDGSYNVTGTLTIRSVSNIISFPMRVSNGIAAGKFIVNRTDYQVGNNGQDDFVDPQVTIQFEVSANSQSN